MSWRSWERRGGSTSGSTSSGTGAARRGYLRVAVFDGQTAARMREALLALQPSPYP